MWHRSFPLQRYDVVFCTSGVGWDGVGGWGRVGGANNVLLPAFQHVTFSSNF